MERGGVQADREGWKGGVDGSYGGEKGMRSTQRHIDPKFVNKNTINYKVLTFLGCILKSLVNNNNIGSALKSC